MLNSRKRRKLHYDMEQLERQSKVPDLPTSDYSKLICCGVMFVSEKKLIGHKQLVHHASSSLPLPCSSSSTETATAVAVEDRSYSNDAVESEPNYNLTGISCLQCDVTLFGTRSAPFISHIFGHIAPPLDIARLRFRCHLCNGKHLFGIVQILNHSRVHPDTPFSQIFPMHTDTGPIFAYLDAGIRSLFGSNDALTVFSIVDSTCLPLPRSAQEADSADNSVTVATSAHWQKGKKNAVVKILPNSFHCLRCCSVIGRDQVSAHVLHHLDINMDDLAIFQAMTGRSHQGRFQCRLCANGQSFDGPYSLRFALLHALTVHQGARFSSIFSWTTGIELLLVNYLRRIVQCLFANQIVSQVMDIVANGAQAQTLRVTTKNQKRELLLVARPQATDTSQGQPMRKKVVLVTQSSATNPHSRNEESIMKKTAVKSEISASRSPVHALNIMPELFELVNADSLNSSTTVKQEETYGCPSADDDFIIGQSEMEQFCAKEVKPCL